MPLCPDQSRILEGWMCSKAISHCPLCTDSSWKFAEAPTSGRSWNKAIRTSPKAGVSCGNCGYVALFDAESLGIRGLWDQGRSL